VVRRYTSLEMRPVGGLNISLPFVQENEYAAPDLAGSTLYCHLFTICHASYEIPPVEPRGSQA
jgi:hypothetical protein